MAGSALASTRAVRTPEKEMRGLRGGSRAEREPAGVGVVAWAEAVGGMGKKERTDTGLDVGSRCTAGVAPLGWVCGADECRS